MFSKKGPFANPMFKNAPQLARSRTLWALLYLTGLWLPGAAFSQESLDSLVFSPVLSLEVTARAAVADNLGNVYLIRPDNAIEKYAPDGRFLSRFSQNRLGRAAWLDVSNPMKVLVFYPDFRTALFLDRNLTLLGDLNLDDAGLPFARTLSLALDGNLWVYDEVNFQLKKIAPTGDLLFESQALNLLLPRPPQPAAIRESENAVFVSDTAQGVFVFDNYAQFSKLLSIKGVADFVVSGERIFYLEKEQLKIEIPAAFRAGAVPLPASVRRPDAWLRVCRGRLVAILPGKVLVFAF